MAPPVVRSALRRWLTWPAAGCLVAWVTSGCPAQTSATCGDEPASAVCGRLGFDCDTVTVCYVCGVTKAIACGQCAAGQTCGGGGQAHVCWPPLDAGVDASPATGAGDANAEDASADAAVEASRDAGMGEAEPDAAPAETLVLCPADAASATNATGD